MSDFLISMRKTYLPILFLVSFLTPLSFQTLAEPEQITAQHSQKILAEVFSGSDFHSEETVTRIRPREIVEDNSDDDTMEIPEWFILLVEWYEGREIDEDNGEHDSQYNYLLLIVQILEVMLWCTVIALIGWLVYRYRHILSTWVALTEPKKSAPPSAEILFGLDLREESLPADVPAQVLVLWSAGKVREALGLLYRASLSKLINQYQFEFYDGHTERECAAIVIASPHTHLHAYMRGLTETWTRLAYAHREPSEAQVQQLCALWPQVFSAEPVT